MRIAIVDDQLADREQLAHDLDQWAKSRQISLTPPPVLFASGEDLLHHFAPGKFDVIFLDIIMDGISGIETAHRIRSADRFCRLVFITTTPEFAVESYDVESSYYIIKPYTPEKLTTALERCGVVSLEQTQYITIPKTRERIFFHRIAYTEYAGRQVHVHYRDGSETIIAMSHAAFAGLLQDYPFFCDCVRGILVNFEAVKELTACDFVLHGGKRIPISRLKYASVRERYLDYSCAKMREKSS